MPNVVTMKNVPSKSLLKILKHVVSLQFSSFIPRPPVDPACRYGICSCKQCSALGENNICTPTKYVPIGEQCSGNANELYPSGSWCDSGAVVCDAYHRPSEDERHCIREDYSESHDKICYSDSDCSNGEVCDDDHAECGCGLRHQRYDEMSRQCVDRKIGDPCSRDEDCAGIQTVGDYRNQPVCSRLYRICTFRLDLKMLLSDIDRSKCHRCPEESALPNCRPGLPFSISESIEQLAFFLCIFRKIKNKFQSMG